MSSSLSGAAPITSPTAPVITSATSANATVGSSFTYNITATNNPTSFEAPGLPAGLTVNATTGVISGTPTAAGNSSATINATNSNGTGNATLSFTIARGTPTITAPPTATPIRVGQALADSTLTGGAASVDGTFAFTTPSTAPASTGNQSVSFTPTDSVNWNTATTNVSVTVNPAPAINVNPTSLTGFSTKPNAASANQSLTVSGSNLEGLVTLNASAGYEVSLDGVTYNSSLSLVPNQPGNRPSPITIASDNAANYGGGWTNGSNSGFGFSAWQTPGGNGTTGFNGFFVGSANATQLPNHAEIYTGGNAFSVYAGDAGGAFQDATRPFASRLLPGQTLTHSMAFSFDNGNKGFNLLSGTTEVFNFNINNGGYSWTGGNAAMTSWPGVRERGVVINFTITRTPTGFSYSFNSTQDSNLTRNGTVTAAGLDTLKYYISGAGGGDGGNIYFNNLQITSVGSNLTDSTVYVRLAANGTPGPASGNLTFTSANATTRTVSLSGTVIALTPPVITSRTINGTVGSNFTASINATNSPTSHTATGTLPPGVTFNATTGNFSGTPTTAGNYTLAATATNADGTSLPATLTFAIARGTPGITTPPTASLIYAGQTLSDSTLSGGAANVPGNFTFAAPSTIPPAGNSTHAVVFTPSDSGNYTSAFGNVTVRVLDVPPGPPIVFNASTGNATVGVPFEYTVRSANSPLTFAEATPLPDGLYLNPETGAITGTPAAKASNFTTTISATNIKGTGTGNLTFTIAKGTPSISVPPVAAKIYPGETVSAPQPALTGGETEPPLEGTFTYANGTQSFTAPGLQTVDIVFTPADTENWNSANGTVDVTVAPQPTYGNLTLNATPGEIEEGKKLSESLILVTLPSAIDRDETITLRALDPNGAAIPASSPSALEADLVDGHGYVSFNRTLEIPIPAGSTKAAFYVRTANTDNFLNEPGGLSATVSANGTYHGAGNTTVAIIEDEHFGKLELLSHNSTQAVLAASVNTYHAYNFVPSSTTNLASGNWTVPGEYIEEADEDQAGVPLGFERKIFTVPRIAPGGPREFFRLREESAPIEGGP